MVRKNSSTFVAVDQTNFLSRLQYETARILAASIQLQDQIQTLNLRDCNADSRKTLQTADALTQSLQCIDAAILGLSSVQIEVQNSDLSLAFNEVFLEDMRKRLIEGLTTFASDPKVLSGEVELF